MKKRLLLTVLATLLTAVGLMAQTDVTSTYLTNPSFESDNTNGLTGVTADGTFRGWALAQPTGWQIENASADEANWPINTLLVSATCYTDNNFGQVTTIPAGTYAYYLRVGWATGASALTQSVTLPAGEYQFQMDYRTAYANSATSVLGLVAGGNTETVTFAEGSEGFFTADKWKTGTVGFTLEQMGTTEVGFSVVWLSGGSCVMVDNCKLFCIGRYFVADAPLPNNTTTNLTSGTWYYYDVETTGDYTLEGNFGSIAYTTNARQFQGSEETTSLSGKTTISLTKGRIYFRASAGGQTLQISRNPGWTGSTPSAGTYYLYNMATGMFLTSGANWGTHVALDPNGGAMPLTLENGSGNTWEISTAALFSGKQLSPSGYMDWEDHDKWTFTDTGLGDGTYRLSSNGTYLVWENNANYSLGTTTTMPANRNGYWKLVTKAALLADLEANAVPGNSISATFLIANSWFGRTIEGWSGRDGSDSWGNISGQETDNAVGRLWPHTFDLYQEFTNLPNGEYVLSAQGVYENNSDYSGSSSFYVTTSGHTTTGVMKEWDSNNTYNDWYGYELGIPRQTYKVENLVGQVVDHTLRIGAKSTDGVAFCGVDNFSLVCNGIYFCQYAIALPNNTSTKLTKDQWYYYDVAEANRYSLTGNIESIIYTTNGAQFVASASGSAVSAVMTLTAGRIYFKPTKDGATLMITKKAGATVTTNTFTVATINVDGLPEKYIGITINSNAPGASGTAQMSKKLNEKQYDIFAVQEDFNYHGNLLSALTGYQRGQWCGSLYSGGDNGASFSSARYDTDGLCLFAKTAYPMTPYVVGNTGSLTEAESPSSSRVAWNVASGGIADGNIFVRKGYRYYTVNIGGTDVDVYVMHTDAGSDSEEIEARNNQWNQLANAINSNSHTDRPKIVMGDTNSRWTREDIGSNFVDILSGLYDVHDCWVEFALGGNYEGAKQDPSGYGWGYVDQSNPSDYSKYEVVDKIFYLNPLSATGAQLVPNSFAIDQDFTYDDGSQISDHKPVVVEFTLVNESYDFPVESTRWTWKGQAPNYYSTDNYLYNVQFGMNDPQHKGFMKNGGSLVYNPNDAIRWQAWGSASGCSFSDVVDDARTSAPFSYRIHMEYTVGWKAGIYKKDTSRRGATSFTIEGPLTKAKVGGTVDNVYRLNYYDGYNVWPVDERETRHFNATSNVCTTGEDNSGYSAASQSSDSNNMHWLFIHQDQVDEYNRYVRAWNKGYNYLYNLPMPEDQQEQYLDLLGRSACWDDGDGGSAVRLALDKLNADVEEWFDDDQTAKIVNPSFELGAGGKALTTTTIDTNHSVYGWTVPQASDGIDEAFASYKTDSNRNFDGIVGNYVYNTWHAGDATFSTEKYFVKQTIPSLDAGYYILQANFTTHPSTGNLADSVSYARPDITLYAGSTSKTLQYINYRPNSFMVDLCFHHEGGSVEIGAKSKGWFEADNFTLRRYDFCEDLKITEAGNGFASAAYRYNTQIPYALTVYIATNVDEKHTSVHMESIGNGGYLKAEEGIVLNGPIGSYRFYRTRQNAESAKSEEGDKDNYLHGTSRIITRDQLLKDNPATDEAKGRYRYEYYMLGNLVVNQVTQERKVGFYRLDLSKTNMRINAKKAYLVYDTQASDDDPAHGLLKSQAKSFYELGFGEYDDDETAIEEVLADGDELEPAGEITAIYDLRGMRQFQLQRGINVVRLSDGTVRKIMVR